MELTTLKTFAVLAIIVGCFAILYPKIFHPIVLILFGLNDNPRNLLHDEQLSSHIPPRVREMMQNNKPSAKDSFSRHAGMHPGLRAAAEMKKHASVQQGGAGKGVMGIVLPMYAVGIVIYLVYTITKIFNKKSKSKDENNVKINYNAHIDPTLQNDENFMKKQIIKKQKDLEKLLLKADDENIDQSEMIELKYRLLETEKQMNKILNAMQMIKKKVSFAPELIQENNFDTASNSAFDEQLIDRHCGEQATDRERQIIDYFENNNNNSLGYLTGHQYSGKFLFERGINDERDPTVQVVEKEDILVRHTLNDSNVRKRLRKNSI